MLIGYARVSTTEQVTHAQTDALTAAGCEVIYEEKRSGGSMARPVLNRILHKLRPGDTLVIYKIDRLARSLKDLLHIIERVQLAGAEFKSLSEAIDTKTAVGRMLLHILGGFAEFERELIRERTVKGLRAAIERGSKPGRPRGLSDEDERAARALWASGGASKTQLARWYGVHLSSIKRAVKRWESEKAGQGELLPQ